MTKCQPVRPSAARADVLAAGRRRLLPTERSHQLKADHVAAPAALRRCCFCPARIAWLPSATGQRGRAIRSARRPGQTTSLASVSRVDGLLPAEGNTDRRDRHLPSVDGSLRWPEVVPSGRPAARPRARPVVLPPRAAGHSGCTCASSRCRRVPSTFGRL